MIGQRIVQARTEKNMSQRELANKVGITRIMLAMIESGQIRRIGTKVAAKLARELDISMVLLLCGE